MADHEPPFDDTEVALVILTRKNLALEKELRYVREQYGALEGQYNAVLAHPWRVGWRQLLAQLAAWLHGS